MAEKKGFDLGDYIEVKDRIRVFYELYGQGRLVTGEVRLTTEPDGKPRVMVQGLAYRTPEDPLPGVGWSWMELPGTTPYTKGSEIENAETSAWGRAIGSLGILIDKSIASANEVQNKAGPDIPPTDPADADSSPNPAQQGEKGEIEDMLGRVRRRGIVRKGSADGYKLVARQGPDGHVFGFRLEIDGRNHKDIPQCLMAGPIGEAAFLALGMEPLSLVGKVATVAGLLYNVKRPDKPGSWYRLHVDLIETAEFILPAPPEERLPEALPEPLGLVDDDLSDLPDGVWIANEASDAGSRR